MKLLQIAAFSCICCALNCLPAQAQAIPSDQPASLPEATTMADAVALRSDMAAKVAMNAETAEAALTRLRNQSSPSGLNIDSDASLSYAAIDVGQRLITLGSPAQAEVFFQAAEQSLDALIRRTADEQSKVKAQYLRKIALIRGEYLNKATQAKLDLKQAITLQPGDKDLLRAKQNLDNSHAPIALVNREG